MGEIKLNSDVGSLVVCKIPLFFRGIYCCLKVPFWDVTLSPSVYWYPVTIQRIVAGLDLSRLRVECMACFKVSFFLGGKSFSHIDPMTV